MEGPKGLRVSAADAVPAALSSRIALIAAIAIISRPVRQSLPRAIFERVIQSAPVPRFPASTAERCSLDEAAAPATGIPTSTRDYPPVHCARQWPGGREAFIPMN